MESTFIPDPNAPPPSDPDQEPTAIRHLTFWQDGFSVEDGELMRYDDPENEQILAQINTGSVPCVSLFDCLSRAHSGHRRAPPHILNVQPGQPVELRVAKRLQEKYTPPPKRPMAAFSGTGNRLGAPSPTVTESSTAMPGAFPTAASSSPATGGSHDRSRINTLFEVDQTLPTTSIQIRLADGTRFVSALVYPQSLPLSPRR